MPDNPANHDESERLNDQARRALLGFSATPEKDLAQLLLTGAPIRQDIRKLLAQALTAETALGCNVRFHRVNSKAKAYQVRKEWYELGEWMEAQDPKSRFELAQDKWAKGVKYCEKALTFSRKVRAWVESVQVPGTVYGTWSTEMLVERFIGFDVDGLLPEPNRTLEAQEEEDRRHVADLVEIFGITEPPYSPNSE